MTRNAADAKRPGGGRPRIDWPAAYAYFESDSRNGFGDVARTFGVSDTAVRKHARPGGDFAEGWEARRDATLAEAAAAVRARNLRSIEERNVRTIEVAERLRDLVLDEDTKIDPNVAARALPRYVQFEQLHAGEATSRVEVGDVQAIVTAVFTVAGRFVPADRRGEFLAEIDGAIGGLVALPGGQAAA